MDGDSGDEGNDKLTCVRSDESDMSAKVCQKGGRSLHLQCGTTYPLMSDFLIPHLS